MIIVLPLLLQLTSTYFDLKNLMLDKNDFLQKSIDVLGATLNPVVSAMHNNPGNNVKFLTKKTVHQCSDITVAKIVPVADPSNSELCPNAFDGRKVLKHMFHYYRSYADALDYPKSLDFKVRVKQIIGRIPKRRNPSLTWGSVINTIFHMRCFIESIADCLEKNGLASPLRNGTIQLLEITERVNQARKILEKERK